MSHYEDLVALSYPETGSDDEHPTNEKQARFREDGYYIAAGLLPDWMIDAYKARWENDMDGEDPFPGYKYPTPYCDVHELFALCTCGQIAQIIESILGGPAGVHLNLTGWRSTQRDWHQDQYLNPERVGESYCGVWMALDDINPDAGPFEFVPGSHRLPCVSQQKIRDRLTTEENASASWPRHSERILTPLFDGLIAERGMEVRSFLAKRGDVLFWNSRLVHRGSAPKDPSLLRPCVIAHYSGIHVRPDMLPARRAPGGGWYFPMT